MRSRSYPERPTGREMLKELAGVTMATQLSSRNYAQSSEADSTAGGSEPECVVLEDSEIRVAFDQASGELTSLTDKRSHWAIQRSPGLGVSFRMQAPLPERHDNFILGQKQRASKVEKLGNQIHLEWRNLVSQHSGTLPITFTATVTLESGALSFDSLLTNHSELIINTVEYPYLGDLSAPTPGIKL